MIIKNPTIIIKGKEVETLGGEYNIEQIVDGDDCELVVTTATGGGSGTSKFKGVVERTVTELTAEDLSGLSRVGRGAFAYNTTLTSVELPDSVSTIEDYAFYDCGSLTDIVIPESVSYIGNNSVFNNCYSLQQITLPDNLYYIGNSMFTSCHSLTKINIPSVAEYIGELAFFACSSLTEITLPSGLLRIENGAFQNCTGLTSITIPDSVTSIGGLAFGYCESLTEMTILAITPPQLVFADAISTATTTIYIPAGTLEAYQTATNWSNFADLFVEMEA